MWYAYNKYPTQKVEVNTLKIFTVNKLDIRHITEEMLKHDAVSIPLLHETFRKALLNEAHRHTYTKEMEHAGSVRQQVETVEKFEADSLYALLARSFQNLIDTSLASGDSHPFTTPLRLNSFLLMKYPHGSIGITPHRDHKNYINLVCIFIIAGTGKFFTCKNRVGEGATEIDTAPGNVILMRAPGFMRTEKQPFHFVTDITKTRYTFGMRQKKEDMQNYY